MKKVALMAICLGSLGLLACGGGDDGPTVNVTDAGISADAEDSCNAVEGTGCGTGEKCTSIIEATEPMLLTRTTCMPVGDKLINGECTRNQETGSDDCEAGGWCIQGTCQEICSNAPDNCPDTKTCVGFQGLFNDQENVGLCQPRCTPYNRKEKCADGESCYVIFSSGKGSCSTPAQQLLETGTDCSRGAGSQGCDCQSLNGCVLGYGCMLNNAPGDQATGSVCSFFCDPLGDGGPSCADAIIPDSDVIDAAGPGPSYSCRQVRTFYNPDGLESLPENIGMCVDPQVFIGCNGCTDPSQINCDPSMMPCCDDGTVTPDDKTDDCDCDDEDPDTNMPDCPAP